MYRRAYVLLIGIASLMGGLALLTAISLDKKMVDPEGFLGPSWLRLPLLVLGALMGMDVRVVAPASLRPAPAVVEAARAVADETGARVTVTDDPSAGVQGVDFVHTDVWVSMGEPKDVWAERIELLTPYQVNAHLMERTGNPAARFMHCLPAYHDLGTTIGREIHAEFGLTALEVTDDVFEGPSSVVFDQAENRLHSIKAVLVATLGG